jgi:hypothetical protein
MPLLLLMLWLLLHAIGMCTCYEAVLAATFLDTGAHVAAMRSNLLQQRGGCWGVSAACQNAAACGYYRKLSHLALDSPAM